MPVTMRMTLTALPITSAGRFWSLDPLGIQCVWRRRDICRSSAAMSASIHGDVFGRLIHAAEAPIQNDSIFIGLQFRSQARCLLSRMRQASCSQSIFDLLPMVLNAKHATSSVLDLPLS